MLIDWFTVVAQGLNFLILVWLMRRYLYRPILHAIDMREKRIAAELADAAAKSDAAQKERDLFAQKNREIGEARSALMKQADDEAGAEKQHLIEEARKESDALRARLLAGLQNEHDRLGEKIIGLAHEEVFAIAKKTLADLSSSRLESEIVDAFIRRFRGLDALERDVLIRAMAGHRGPAVVKTAFDLSVTQQRAIELAIKETLGSPSGVRFMTSPELISGIELIANGKKVSWSIAAYLDSFQNSLADTLKGPLPAASSKANTGSKGPGENI